MAEKRTSISRTEYIIYSHQGLVKFFQFQGAKIYTTISTIANCLDLLSFNTAARRPYGSKGRIYFYY